MPYLISQRDGISLLDFSSMIEPEISMNHISTFISISVITIFFNGLPSTVMTGESLFDEGRASLPVLLTVPHIAIQLSGRTSRLLLAKFASCMNKMKKITVIFSMCHLEVI